MLRTVPAGSERSGYPPLGVTGMYRPLPLGNWVSVLTTARVVVRDGMVETALTD